MRKTFCVYILASRHRVLYIGVTNNIYHRLAQHRSHANPNSFTARYNVTRLVYVEHYQYVADAINREKELKGWRRAKKVRLIEQLNPSWDDLAPPDGGF